MSATTTGFVPIPTKEGKNLQTLYHAAVLNCSHYQRLCTEALSQQSNNPALEQAVLDVEYLTDPDRNNLFNPAHQHVYQDMNRPIGDYFLYSSHNTYIAGNQLYGNASLDAIQRALVAGVRVIELDCMVGSSGKYHNQIIVKHRFTPMHPILLSKCLHVVKRWAFATTDYPVILTIENHCASSKQQRVQAHMLRNILQDSLYIPSLNEQRSYQYHSPEELKGFILLRHKFKIYDLHTSTPTREPSPPPGRLGGGSGGSRTTEHIKSSRFGDARNPGETKVDYNKNKNKNTNSTNSTNSTVTTKPTNQELKFRQSNSPTPSSSPIRTASMEDTTNTTIVPTATASSPSNKTLQLEEAREKAFQIYKMKLSPFTATPSRTVPPAPTMARSLISKLPFGKKARKSKKAIDANLSQLIFICNQKVKVKTIKMALRSPFVFSTSWGEGKIKRALQSRKVLLKTMAFCKKHLMRVYPAYYRLDSSNFNPQKVWNAGVQMVALNTQSWGTPQSLNQAKFNDNGRSGYVLKPKWLRLTTGNKTKPTKGNSEANSSSTFHTAFASSLTNGGNVEEGTEEYEDEYGADRNVDDVAPMVLIITPIACWLPHQAFTDNERPQTPPSPLLPPPTMSSTASTFAKASTASTSTSTNTAFVANRRASKTSSPHFSPSSSPTNSVPNFGDNHYSSSSSSSSSSSGGIVMHAVLYGADPTGLTSREIKQTSTPSIFCGCTNREGHSTSDGATSDDSDGYKSNVLPASSLPPRPTPSPPPTVSSSPHPRKEYAAWRWNDHGGNDLHYNIFEPTSSHDGMEMLSVTLIKDVKKKKIAVGQFSIAVANMRCGLRVVELQSSTNGKRLEGGASILVNVKIERRQNLGLQSKRRTEGMMQKVSSSNCLKLLPSSR